jgi:hypothetical protein
MIFNDSDYQHLIMCKICLSIIAVKKPKKSKKRIVLWGSSHHMKCLLCQHDDPIYNDIQACEYLINNSQISGEFIDGKSYYYKLGLLANTK